MKSHHIEEFRGEPNPPVLFVDPLHDNGALNTIRGEGAYDPFLRTSMREAIGPREEDDNLAFSDTSQSFSKEWILDRFQNVTEGLNPGTPQIRLHEYAADTPLEEIIGAEVVETERRLDRFFQDAKITPPNLTTKRPQGDGDVQKGRWGGSAFKLNAEIKMPQQEQQARSFLHELGHCTMGAIGFERDVTTHFDDENDLSRFRVHNQFNIVTAGLTHVAEGELRGSILEEGVAEAVGSLVNQRLGIVVPERLDSNIPDELQKYIIDGGYSQSSPAALALELIANEMGMPFEQYLKLLISYANSGVQNIDSRQEIAESIYRGTRGRLTLSQVEGLPYPMNKRASLALLWAVESALDIPDHLRYSQHFFVGE